jgi:20S proteasome alpha/beta subunit
MTQTILYGKRFFPYYVYTMLGGLDADGKGAIYGFDPVGSYERLQCGAGGAASSLIMPFLDNQVRAVTCGNRLIALGDVPQSVFGEWRTSSFDAIAA